MSAPDVYVYSDMGPETHLVGFLWIKETRRGATVATFQYADSWTEDKAAFAVDPLWELWTCCPRRERGRSKGAI